MPFRARGFSRGGSKPRRPMDWVAGEIDSTTGGAAGSTPGCSWLCDPGEMVRDFTDPTLMALRVWGQARPNGATTALSVFGLGIISWNFTTDADGVAVVPTQCPRLFNLPGQGCQDEDWIYQWIIPSAGGEDSTTGRQTVNDGADRQSKARRRLGNDRGILFVVQALGVVNYDYHFHARALIKE